MGENIMILLKILVVERGWLGDEGMGWCLNCYLNVLILGEL